MQDNDKLLHKIRDMTFRVYDRDCENIWNVSGNFENGDDTEKLL